MFTRILLITAYLSPLIALAQSNYTDSVAAVIRSAKEDTAKVITINELVLELRDNDPNKALDWAMQAKALSEKLNFRKGLGNTLQNIGWIYYRKGDYSLALENSLEALSINNEFGDKTVIANCLNNIGAIKYEQEQYKSAVSYFKQGYVLSSEIKSNSIMSRSLNNISLSYLALKQLDSAEYYVKIAIDEGSKADTRLDTGFADRILGDIYFEKQQWRQALESFNTCLVHARERNLNSLVVSTLHRIGRTYLKLGLPDAALTYLKENVDKAKAMGYKDELEKTYALLTEAYIQKNDLAKAIRFQSLFIQIHDSLYNKNSAQQIAQMESKYKSEIKEASIALLTKDKELQKEEIKTQRIVIYSFFLGLAVLTGLAFVLYNSNQRVKKANLELAMRNEEVKIQAEQLRHLNATKDKLFSIISHDLRGPIGGLRGLMDLLGRGALSQEEFNGITKQLKLNLDYLHDDLDNLLNWARNQLGGFEPNPEFISLKEEIADKINLFTSLSKAKSIMIHSELTDGLQGHIDRNHLSLVLRNLISNAIKFSHPDGRILIKTDFKSGKVLLSVQDFGVGMSQEDVTKLFSSQDHFTRPGTQKEKGTGLGLMLVKEFAEKNKSSIRVESETGKGSTFIVEMNGRAVAS